MQAVSRGAVGSRDVDRTGVVALWAQALVATLDVNMTWIFSTENQDRKKCPLQWWKLDDLVLSLFPLRGSKSHKKRILCACVCMLEVLQNRWSWSQKDSVLCPLLLSYYYSHVCMHWEIQVLWVLLHLLQIALLLPCPSQPRYKENVFHCLSYLANLSSLCASTFWPVS